MLVADVQASIRFYQTLGFHVAATEMDAAGHPLWALLRRGEADLFVMARTAWAHPEIPLPEQPPAMTLVLGDGACIVQTDPDGVAVQTGPVPLRRAA